MGIRREGRELALKALYQTDLLDRWKTDTFDEIHHYLQHPEPVTIFGKRLFQGVRTNKKQIDMTIQHYADNWTMSRMNIVDRNILRIAAYEIVFCEDIPKGVSIHEAIELAKLYSSKDAGSFVNGILDRLPALDHS